jgi:hypothetical protein
MASKIPMNNYKQRLIILLIVDALLMLVHVLLREQSPVSGNIIENPWHYWLVLVFNLFVVLYAFSLRCPNSTCQRRQVFRGYSIFDVRWPGNNCYYCGVPLSTKYKHGKPIDP